MIFKNSLSLFRLPFSLILVSLLISFTCFVSCNDTVTHETHLGPSFEIERPVKARMSPMHKYGGWYCPDNLRGFPAVDVEQLDKVPVVVGRLPTKEETRSGSSLMYFDSLEYPDAKPLDIKLPAIARYYSETTKKNELVVVIQAVVSGSDTVCGFRYVNGGNGSGWLSELDFLSESETSDLNATPFVTIESEINATPAQVWKVLTETKYAQKLGSSFDDVELRESDWKQNSVVLIKDAENKVIAKGLVSVIWKDMYIQVDYNFEGFHYVEKFLLLESEDQLKTNMIVVAGPFGKDYETKKIDWMDWETNVRSLSETL